ncbi:MAG: site-2 protease family protein [Gemmatimonadaceae bacterium]
MLSNLPSGVGAWRPPSFVTSRLPRWRRGDLSAMARRLGQFWIIWSALLIVHESGHAISAWRQGLDVDRITVGAGPVLWRGDRGETQLVLRLVPVVGMTTIGGQGGSPGGSPGGTAGAPAPAADGAGTGGRWDEWGHLAAILGGGVLATLLVALGMAGIVAALERATRRRCVWGRILVADAVVLTIFNFLPVPPLDGGRAVLGAVAAWRGSPLAGDALFWLHVGGLALAVAPMTLWTRWTARIDAVAMWRWAPRPDR